MIIIDTLQKVREVGVDKFSYASDYEIVTKLKAFIDKYGICFLVVHHTRKMESTDSFDMISESIDGKIRQYGKTSVIYNIQNSTNRGRTGKGKTRIFG